MHDVIVLLLRYVRGTWRYRWWMLGIAWVVCLVGWTVVARMPDQYKASAQVYVDTSSILQPYLQGLAISNTNTDRLLFLMTRSLLTQPTLEKVMRMTDLDLQAKTPQEQEEIIEELRKNITLGGTRRENLYTIEYENDSPELAKLVVKSLLTIFMEGNLGEVRRDQDSATQFLEEQIAEYERRMLETEREIAGFKQKNLALLPSESMDYYDRMRVVKAKVEEARLALQLEEDRLESLRAQVQGEVPTFGLGPQAAPEALVDTSQIDRRIEAMELRLDELLVRFTERHPDVIAAQRSLDDLRAQRAGEIARARREMAQFGGSGAYNVDQNPVYQQLKLSLSSVEAEVAVKRGLLEAYEAEAARLENQVDAITSLDAQGKELARAYDTLRRQHGELESRLEKARLGRRADTSADSVDFRIIDPPRVPSTPSGPPRVLLSAVVLAAGLLIGLAVAFLMSQIRPTFDERQLMNDELGLPVLGSVNMVWTTEQIKAHKARNVSFVASLASLVLVFTTVLLLYQFNIDLLPRLAQSLNMT